MVEDVGILVVEDDAAMREACLSVFSKEGFRGAGVATAHEALAGLEEKERFEIVVTDLRLPGMDGLALLREIKKQDPAIDVVLMTGYGTIKSAVEAMKVGASDYLTKPFEMDALLVVVRRLVRMRKLEGEVARLRTELKERYRFGNIVGGGPRMREVFELTRAAADSHVPVIIEGESGTGKELVARAIHYEGLRSRGPFVPVNCGALPTDLFESELFGHRRGAFTGAHQSTRGLFVGADGGTIFLDEITEMPLEAQVKLLRVLEDKRVRAVGAVESVDVDVRVVAAANQPLAPAVKAGTLREDLFYRLGVIVISVPPLRERGEDVPALAMHFVQQLNEGVRTPINGLSAEALDALCTHAWPGNVRELRNVIESLYALGRRGRIGLEDLPRSVRCEPREAPPPAVATPVQTLHEAERNLVGAALRAAKGNKSEAARVLGISRSRLYHFIRLHRIRV
ncbi:MAG: sigma-54-dependent transcriptional regulator [Planctomycetota bacterium]|jgi:DNA-binding NtrC family response regulator